MRDFVSNCLARIDPRQILDAACTNWHRYLARSCLFCHGHPLAERLRLLTSIQPLAETVRRLVAFEAGGGIDTVEQGIAIARRLHERLVQRLSPVIGEAGFEALFARSVKKTKPAVPALQALETVGVAHDVLRQVWEHLKTQDIAAIEEIMVALMVTFIILLSSFIGNQLAWKLLRDTWPEALPSEVPSGETL